MSGLFPTALPFPLSTPHQPQPLGTSMWDGKSFNIWPLYQSLSDFSGVYIYTRLINCIHYAVYVGQSEAVGRRIQEHKNNEPQIESASQHIHCLTVPEGEWARLMIERRLIAALNPPLNTAHRTAPAAKEISAIILDRWSPLAGLFFK